MKNTIKKKKYVRKFKIALIIFLLLVAISCAGYTIYLSQNIVEAKVFSTKHISWIDWVNKESAHSQRYKHFIVSPSQSKIFVETTHDKYIVDSHGATLNSALSINYSNGTYNFSLFNGLIDATGKVSFRPETYTPDKVNNSLAQPLSLMVVALVSVISASIFYKNNINVVHQKEEITHEKLIKQVKR